MIFFGADHAGFALKDALVAVAKERGLEVTDLGTNGDESVDYPDFGHAVAKSVLENPGSLGVLVCGTGQGISMSANRHPGIRAALCSDIFSAQMSRMHNNANILCMGARVVGGGLAVEILNAFLGAEFEGGRHARRVAKIELA
ncbi:MAG: ribose 5-phosphate isomerase B [Polyangiales bacterium]